MSNHTADEQPGNRTPARGISRQEFLRTAGALSAGLAAFPMLAATAHAQDTRAPSGTVDGRVAGQVALVTGAARGIGRAVALTLAREGADIAILDIAIPDAMSSVGYPLATPADLAETERLIVAQGRRCLVYQGDIRDAERMRHIVADVVAQWLQLDILIANAGILPRVSLDDTTDDVWRECIDVNLTGTANALRAAVPHMRLRQSGRIVVVASEFARRCLAPQRVVYTASKWGVLGLMKAAALELSQTGITVNAVSPGFTRSGMTETDEVYRQVSPDSPTLADTERIIRERNVERNALPISFVETQDIADGVLYLVSDAARYVSGVSLDITGGYSPQYTA